MKKTYTAYCDTPQQAKDYIASLIGTEFQPVQFGNKDGKFYIIVQY